jgi:hypothetical protein
VDGNDGGVVQWDDIEDDGEGQFGDSDTLDDDLVADPLDVGIIPPDRWRAANKFGTTPEEMRIGPSLSARLAEEMPDEDPDGDPADDEDEISRRGYEREPRAGRLIADDEFLLESDMLAIDAGVDAGAATAEEAAMHIVDDPDGAGDGPLRD